MANGLNITAAEATALGGKLWKKPGTDVTRYYFSAEVWAPLAGLEVTRYGTGNISSACLAGEGVSNARAAEYLSVRVYVQDGAVHVDGSGRRSLEIAPSILAGVNTAVEVLRQPAELVDQDGSPLSQGDIVRTPGDVLAVVDFGSTVDGDDSTWGVYLLGHDGPRLTSAGADVRRVCTERVLPDFGYCGARLLGHTHQAAPVVDAPAADEPVTLRRSLDQLVELAALDAGDDAIRPLIAAIIERWGRPGDEVPTGERHGLCGELNRQMLAWDVARREVHEYPTGWRHTDDNTPCRNVAGGSVAYTVDWHVDAAAAAQLGDA